MTKITNAELTGLMGSAEMECAVAVIINLAREQKCRLKHLGFKISDFDNGDGYTLDGFKELRSGRWIVGMQNTFYLTADLIKRIRSRIKMQ